MGMSYQGLVAGGNLRAEWCSEAQAGLAYRQPPPRAAGLEENGHSRAATMQQAPCLY
eukprot:CAMPEP_0194670548 /NCGR_PEP_ID=MMETSP0295-20121207/5273_1 /TAXON_ID=39354 /ORGANISM="Heterosigma akashiwo, Strain CCMP2393" /LENGTH=56 /DNA_ID=CAMNT_0039553803 /DNA_START=107 /DNA_END=277 /DNA_ORIENTATION=+